MPVVWRDATHADVAVIERLWDEQEGRFEGTNVPVDRPVLFYPEGDTEHAFYPYKPPVMRVRVGEESGAVVAFKYHEAVLETCIVTGNEETMKSLGVELTQDAHYFKGHGFRSGWGLVPAKFAGAMGYFLRRFPHIRLWRSLTPVGINFNELGD